MDLEAVYRRSPPALQNVMATAFGMRERRLRYGGQFRQFLTELEGAERLPSEQLLDIQNQRLRAILRFAAERVPHYRKLFRTTGLDWQEITSPADLRALPLLEKETVRANPSAFVPENHDGRLIPLTTGGTTGTPLRYMVTPTAMQFSYATYEARFRSWAGVSFGERMASINGRVIVPIEQQSAPFWRHNLAFNQLYLSAYHLSEQNLDAYVERLRRYNPVQVVGYVSSVHLIARHILDRGLVGAVRPRAVLVSSETLFPGVRNEIETAFGCRVSDGYSLGEMTAFISECPAGSMHISPEYGVVEFVRINGQTEIVSTGLFNHGTVLIRYRTGDMASPTEAPCPCGRTLPRSSAIAGRVDEAVITATGIRVGPAPLSLAFQDCRGIREAQIVQAEPGAATVLIVPTAEFGDEEERFLEGELSARLGPSMRLVIERVQAIPRTVSGKRRLIVSAVSR